MLDRQPPTAKADLPREIRSTRLTVLRDANLPYGRCPNCQARLDISPIGTRWTIRSPTDVADRLTLQLGSLEREELYVLSLNTRNHVLTQDLVYAGNVSTALVRVAEVFTAPIRRHAAGLIVAHNHPSGDPTPSPDDLHLTAELIAAGRLLDLPVLDHIIIARDTYVSLRDRGISFDSGRGR